MRKDQFIEAATNYNKRALAACLIPLLIALVCVVSYAPFQRRFELYLGSRFAGPIPDILAMTPATLPVIVAFAVMIPLSRRIDRRFGIACQHCGKPLAHFKAIVIASKNCPYCGLMVLDDNL